MLQMLEVKPTICNGKYRVKYKRANGKCKYLAPVMNYRQKHRIHKNFRVQTVKETMVRLSQSERCSEEKVRP